jgi:hypothetical protein
MRVRMLGWSAAATIAVLAVCVPAAAQTDASPPARGCYQARPLPACRSFWITEFGASWYGESPGGGGRTPDRRRVIYSWEFGYMRNRAANDAAGATLFLSSNDQFMRSGIRVRYRRWLSDAIAADIAPSLIVLQASDDLEVRASPGASLQGSLALRGWLALTTELETTRGGVRVLSGIRVGSYPGAAAALALPALIFVEEGLDDDS